MRYYKTSNSRTLLTSYSITILQLRDHRFDSIPFLFLCPHLLPGLLLVIYLFLVLLLTSEIHYVITYEMQSLPSFTFRAFFHISQPPSWKRVVEIYFVSLFQNPSTLS